MIRNDAEPVLSSNYLVKNWLDPNCLSVMYGPSNSGKTFVALDMANHIATGDDWHGHRITAGGALYIATEGGRDIANRLAALKQERPEKTPHDLIILPSDLDMFNILDTDALIECLCHTEDPPQVALIVIDTLARSMGTGDENAAQDVGQFIGNCDRLRQVTGAHVMIIHHTGKDKDRGARGSSALRAAVDNEIQISAPGDGAPGCIISRKQRDQEMPQHIYFTLRQVVLGQDEDGNDVTSAVVDLV